MKRMIYAMAALLFSAPLAQAQTMSLSLEQAVETGLKNRYDVQADRYDLELAANSVNKAKKEWIPELTGNGNIRYNSQIQNQLIPAGFAGLPEPLLVGLGAKNITVFGLDLSQPIYRPGITTDVKVARNNLEIQKERNRQDENIIRQKITESYLNVLLRELQWKIMANNEQRYSEYLGVAEGRMKNGSLIENDYLRAKLDYDNSRIETQKARQSYELAIVNLKYQMNVAPDSDVKLSGTLDDIRLVGNRLTVEQALDNRTEIRQMRLQMDGGKLMVNRMKQNAIPTISAFANYSQQFMYNNFNYSQRQWWSPFSYVGLRFSVPITQNFKNYNSIHEYKLKQEQLDWDLKQKTADVGYQIQSAGTELENAERNMQAAKDNYELSKTVYANQKQQYDFGSLAYGNLLDTERSLSAAEQNYIKSVYDFLVAQIGYQKAIGNF